MKAIIAEDERLVAMGLSLMLKKLGLEVSACCSSGESCIKLATLHQPDVVFMDIRMASEHDGIDAAREIKRSMNSAIVFTTAYDDAATRTLASEISYAAFLVKPVREASIQAVLKSLGQTKPLKA